jgi:hypothetical protein
MTFLTNREQYPRIYTTNLEVHSVTVKQNFDATFSGIDYLMDNSGGYTLWMFKTDADLNTFKQWLESNGQ